MKMEYINTTEFVCIYCGRPLSLQKSGRKSRQMYCDRYCQQQYERFTTAEERRQNREIIKRVRLNPEKQCATCGNMFRSPARQNRRYCSRSCYHNRNSAMVSNMQAEKQCAYSEKAFGAPSYPQSRYCSDTSVKKVRAEHLADNQAKKSQASTPSLCDYCESAEEWLRVLRKEMNLSEFERSEIITDIKPVRLICENVRINKSVNSFAAIIQSKGFDPFDGGYYAFCGLMRNRIRYTWWSNYGFLTSSCERYHGSYIWPNKSCGEVITLTAREFDFILKGSKPPKFPDKIII